MELGFVHFSTEERKRVFNALERLRDKGSIDELGIGRVRDAFADMMFPGISTLQHHAKYFAVLPHLYNEVLQGHYRGPREVKEKVIELEIKLTRSLVEGSPENTGGITGSKFVKAGSSKYVKYDPSYIYWTGLVAFGIMKESGALYNMLYDYSCHDKPIKYRGKESEESQDGGLDDLGPDGYKAFFSCPHTCFNINKPMDISLTEGESRFIKNRILTSDATKNSLLAYFLMHDEIECPKNAGEDDFLSFDSSLIDNHGLRKQFDLARKFSRFIRPMHIRYNYIFADGCGDIDSADALESLFLENLDMASDVYNVETLNEIFKYLKSLGKDAGLDCFCSRILELTSLGMKNDDFSKLDDYIACREQEVKDKVRYKLRHPEAYKFDPGHLVHDHYLTYRWGTTWTMINEIREGLA